MRRGQDSISCGANFGTVDNRARRYSPLVLGFISWTSFAHDRYLACADRRDPNDVDKCSISYQGWKKLHREKDDAEREFWYREATRTVI